MRPLLSPLNQLNIRQCMKFEVFCERSYLCYFLSELSKRYPTQGSVTM